MGFSDHFTSSPQVTIKTPGRVNLIGEHTDYNDGFVLPTVIPQVTTVAVARRGDAEVHLYSDNIPGRDASQSYQLGRESKTGAWHDYIQGVTKLLAELGHKLGGFDAYVHSDVPTGSGLSSSAALEVATTKALRDLFKLSINDIDIARLGQRVENEFVGAKVGIMDQMAVSLATPGQALFLDTRSLTYQLVPIPKAAGLIVINSGVKHSNIGGGYGERRAQCEAAAKALGVKALRDLSTSDLARIDALSDPVSKRARHVVTENARVLATVEALRAGDLREVGRLFNASHASMRDDFAVSIPEIDCLVDLATRQASVYGARLTGGGFGGSIVALADPSGLAQTALAIADAYQSATGEHPTVLVP